MWSWNDSNVIRSSRKSDFLLTAEFVAATSLTNCPTYFLQFHFVTLAERRVALTNVPAGGIGVLRTLLLVTMTMNGFSTWFLQSHNAPIWTRKTTRFNMPILKDETFKPAEQGFHKIMSFLIWFLACFSRVTECEWTTYTKRQCNTLNLEIKFLKPKEEFLWRWV